MPFYYINSLCVLKPIVKPVEPILTPIIEPLCPLLDILPLNLTGPIMELLGAVKLENYPKLESSLAKYNNYTDETRPKCCRPDQFPDLFTFLFDFFKAFENLGITAMELICQILQFVTPLGCKNVFTGEPNGLLGVGCVIDSLLGPLFGRLGEIIGTLVVKIFGSLDKIDGCLITGVGQIFNKVAYGKPNPDFGSAVGPIATVGSTLLSVVFTTMYCMGEPGTSFIGDAYIESCKVIVDLCEKEAAQGFW